MNPTVAIVGRPNVGKSTLFNRIIGGRKALVKDVPGVTRDRLYGTTEYEGFSFTVIDTGGFELIIDANIKVLIREQIMVAIDESDLILFVTDGREGLTHDDIDISRNLRKTNKKILLIINKIDEEKQLSNIQDFYSLGYEKIFPISAEHGKGIAILLDEIKENLPRIEFKEEIFGGIKLAFIGRPNVGKSSLINAIMKEKRVLVDEKPGTTRDSIDINFKLENKHYTLIDTAGIRRKGKTKQVIEKLSIIKALKSIERCDITLLTLDAQEKVTAQDANIAGYAHEKGRGIIIVVNKWDLIEDSRTIKKDYIQEIRRQLPFIHYAPVTFVSALISLDIMTIFSLSDKIYEQLNKKIPTSVINDLLKEAIQKHHPPVVKGRQLKIYYGTQLSTSPPLFIIFVNDPNAMHFSYERYLVNTFRKAFSFEGCPIKFRIRGRREN